MKVKVKREMLAKTSKLIFDSFYSDIDDINDNNLDKHQLYKSNGITKLQVRGHNGLKYLGYYKQDRDTIQKMIPITNHMFDKLLKAWFINKYNIEINSVLLPLKRFNNYD